MANVKKYSQDQDVAFPNPPSDGISSISINGSQSTQSNMVIAGSWDNGVRIRHPNNIHNIDF